MKTRFAPIFVIAALVIAAVLAQPRPRNVVAASTSDTGNREAISGIWRARMHTAEMNSLPAITLNVTWESGSLSGSVLFYLLRKDAGQPVTSTPGVPEPLLNPWFDGATLTFRVSHRNAHPPQTLKDPPASFRLRLTGPGKGELSNDSQDSARMEMFRDRY